MFLLVLIILFIVFAYKIHRLKSIIKKYCYSVIKEFFSKKKTKIKDKLLKKNKNNPDYIMKSLLIFCRKMNYPHFFWQTFELIVEVFSENYLIYFFRPSFSFKKKVRLILWVYWKTVSLVRVFCSIKAILV